MRLHVQASGISEGLLTAKCGSVKRQHVLHGASEAPFQLSLVKPPLPLEIEASVRRGKQCQESLVQSRQADGLYKVPLRGKHGQRMSVTFRAQPLSKAEKAKQAKEDRADAYFQKHGLNEFLKGMFDRLASEQPEDPYSFLRELYADAAKAERGEGQGNAQTCPPAEAEEPAVLTEPAAAEPSAVTAQAEAEKPAVQTEPVQSKPDVAADSSATVAAQAGVEEPAVQPQPDVAADPSATVAAQAEAEKPAVQTEPVQSKPDVAADSSATVAAQAGVEEPAVQPQPDVAADPSATVAAQAAVQTEPVKPTPDVAADSSATAAAQAATSVSLQALRRKARDAISKGYVDGGLVNALQKLPAFQAATPGSLPIAQGEAPVNQSSSVRAAVQTEAVQPTADVAEPFAVAAQAKAEEAQVQTELVQPTATSAAATSVSLQALRRKARDAISKGYVDGGLVNALQKLPAFQAATPGSLPIAQGEAPVNQSSSVREQEPAVQTETVQPAPDVAEPSAVAAEAEEPTPAAAEPSADEVVAEPVAEPVQPTPDVAAGSPATGPPAQAATPVSLQALRRKARDAISKGYVDGRLATALQQNPACQVAPGSLPLPEHRTSRKPSPSHLRANTQPTPFLAEPLVTFTAPGSETISLHALRRKARDAISKGYVDGRLATALQTLAAVLPSGLSTFQLPTLTRAA
ncbi:unnamed protein product [Effrenium voratum]|uniref:Uncharacterized protein n=1 Tax=Effrenium voratum TaxID=2562239 RepID=A0AA36MNF2_9DINO|nr:unnamed protein product [Effrenium voratum]CAJ1373503.1 unnamed protein product [Effrenium voratum]